MNSFLGAWRASPRDVTADRVNQAWRKWMDPSKLQIVMAGKEMAAVKKVSQLAVDEEIAKFPFGARGVTAGARCYTVPPLHSLLC